MDVVRVGFGRGNRFVGIVLGQHNRNRDTFYNQVLVIRTRRRFFETVTVAETRRLKITEYRGPLWRV
jgi:hypothetical protein